MHFVDPSLNILVCSSCLPHNNAQVGKAINVLDGLAINSMGGGRGGASWLEFIRILLVFRTLIYRPAVLAMLHSLAILDCICPTGVTKTKT